MNVPKEEPSAEIIMTAVEQPLPLSGLHQKMRDILNLETFLDLPPGGNRDAANIGGVQPQYPASDSMPSQEKDSKIISSIILVKQPDGSFTLEPASSQG